LSTSRAGALSTSARELYGGIAMVLLVSRGRAVLGTSPPLAALAALGLVIDGLA
jgi:hypothetical protein